MMPQKKNGNQGKKITEGEFIEGIDDPRGDFAQILAPPPLPYLMCTPLNDLNWQ